MEADINDEDKSPTTEARSSRHELPQSLTAALAGFLFNKDVIRHLRTCADKPQDSATALYRTKNDPRLL